MEFIKQIIIASFTGILIENTVFSRALGTSTLISVSKNRKNILGFGLCAVYITTVTSIICFFIDRLINYYKLSYIYMPLIYVLILGFVYIVTLLLLWKFFYNLFFRMKKYVHMSAFNCAVFGALFLNHKYCSSLAEYIGHGIGISLGFILAVYMVSIVYDKLYSENVPYSFRGYPLILIYIGILSMAFYGLVGRQLLY